MKKLVMTTCMAIVLPIYYGHNTGCGVCMAEDNNQKPLDWPDIIPVYDSFFDYVGDVLYIYGSLQYTAITVEVTHNGQTIIMDVLSPNDLPTQYNFNGCDSGSYYVTISAGNTLITTFSFNLI